MNEEVTTIIRLVISITLIGIISIIAFNYTNDIVKSKIDSSKAKFLAESDVLDFKFNYATGSINYYFRPNSVIDKNGITIIGQVYDVDNNKPLSGCYKTFNLDSNTGILSICSDIKNTEESQVRLTVLFNNKFAFEQGFTWYKNNLFIKFEGKTATINGQKFLNDYLTSGNYSYITFMDRHKFLNNTYVALTSTDRIIDLNDVNKLTVSLDYDKNENVVINQFPYRSDNNGKISFIMDDRDYMRDILVFFPKSGKTKISSVYNNLNLTALENS